MLESNPLKPTMLVGRLGVLPVEVRCYTSCFRRLARNVRCNTVSRLTAGSPPMPVFRAHLARNARCNAMSPLTAAGCTFRNSSGRLHFGSILNLGSSAVSVRHNSCVYLGPDPKMTALKLTLTPAETNFRSLRGP